MAQRSAAGQSRIMKVKSDEYVFYENDIGKELFVIQSGKVQVLKKIGEEEALLATLSKGSLFGEMAIFSDGKRSASIKAVEDTELLVINETMVKAQFSAAPEWVKRMFEILIKRLKDTDSKIKARFKLGIEVSVLNLLELIINKYGTEEGKYYYVPVDITMEKLHDILGLSKSEISECLKDLKYIGLISTDTIKKVIRVQNKEKFNGFLEYIEKMLTMKEEGQEDAEWVQDKYYSDLLKVLLKNKKEIFIIS